MKLKIILVVIFSLIVISLTCFLQYNRNLDNKRNPCEEYFREKKMEFKSTILEIRKRDRQCVVINFEEKEELWISNPDLHKYGKVGDSVIKKRGELNCTLKTKNNLLILPFVGTHFRGNVNCEDSTHLEYYD